MRNKETKYYIIIGALTALYFFFDIVQPNKTDWEPSFSRDSKTPYGAYVVYDLLDDIFEKDNIMEVKSPIYSVIADSFFYEPTAFIAINTSFEVDEYDINEMLYFLSAGKNHIFLSAMSFPAGLEDTLGFRVNPVFSFESKTKDSTKARFFNPSLDEGQEYDMMKENNQLYFSELDTANTVVLACNNQGKPNLIKIPHGVTGGAFILSTTPFMMTNYHMLYKENHGFIETAFSHIPKESMVMWDEYYKVGHQRLLQATKGSTLGFVMSQPPLKWAWYLMVFSSIIYVLFEAKRKQRIIPIIKPLPNMTLDFTETIGRLYFQSKNHKNIADKKIRVFLEYIRSHFFIRTHEIDEEFIKTLTAKSEIPEGEIRGLVQMIRIVRKQDDIMEDTLIQLNAKIEGFYKQTKTYQKHKTTDV